MRDKEFYKEIYEYDAFGRVSEQSGSDYKNSYTYDLNSNVASYILKQNDTVKNSESYVWWSKQLDKIKYKW